MKINFFSLALLALLIVVNLSCDEDDDKIIVHGTVKWENGSFVSGARLEIKGFELKGMLWPDAIPKHSVDVYTNAKGEFRVNLPGDKKIDEVTLRLWKGDNELNVLSGCPMFCEFEAKSNMKIELVVY